MCRVYRVSYVLLSLILLLTTACQQLSPHSSINENTDKNTAASSLVLPIERWQTSAGAQVIYVHNDNLPMVDINVSFAAGAIYDNDLNENSEKKLYQGLAAITNSLLGEATRTQDAQSISETFENIGAQFSTDIDQLTAELSLRTLTGESLEQSVDQLRLILSETVFTEEAYTRVKGQLTNYLRYMQTNPSQQATQFYNQTLYGKQDIGRDKWGSLTSLILLTLPRIQAFYQQFYTNDSMLIAITGDVDKQKAHVIAEQLSAARPAKQKNIVIDNPSYIQKNSGVYHKAFNAAQTQIYIGNVTIGRQDSDYAAFKLANEILGGGSTSRLYQTIREEQGLSYSVYSHFSPFLNQGEFTVTMQTASGQAQQAVSATLTVLDNFVKNGITQQELDQAKASYRMAFAQAFTSNAGINGYLMVLGRNQLDDYYLSNFLSRIESTTVEQVNAAIRRVINPDQLLIVTLGDESDN